MYIQQRRIPIVNAVTIRAAAKIWQFYKYQTLVNNKIEEMIQEVMPKIKTVLQVKKKKSDVGLGMKEYYHLCTKALENKANLLRPLLLLNSRNIHSHLEYFTEILEILRYSTGDEQHSFIIQSLLHQDKSIEQKQIFKILNLSFILLESELKEVIRCQILICLDSILMVLVECSKESPQLIDKLKTFVCFSRTIAYKQQYQGINQFLQLIGSFQTQINPVISDLHLQNTLQNLMQQLECPICQMYFTQPVSMQCGHNFCKACITSDQLIMKKCPLCRAEQKDNINLSEENQFLTSILSKIVQFKNQNIEEEKIVLDQDSQEIINDYQSLLVLKSKTPICLYLEQCVEIDCKKFDSITSQQFQQILLKYPIFILIDQNTNQGYLVENKLSKILGKKLYIMIESMAKLIITEQLFEDQQFNEDDLIFSYEIANAKTEKDELINVNDPNVSLKLKNHLENITKLFKDLLQNQTNDQTFQILNSFLQKCGFLTLMGSNLFQNYEQMKKFSYLLPNILRIKKEEQIQIAKSNNLMNRLELLERSIKRFQYSVSPLAVFKINQPAMFQQRNWTKYFIIILICILVHIIEF